WLTARLYDRCFRRPSSRLGWAGPEGLFPPACWSPHMDAGRMRICDWSHESFEFPCADAAYGATRIWQGIGGRARRALLRNRTLLPRRIPGYATAHMSVLVPDGRVHPGLVRLRPAPSGMPATDVAPPTIAESGDPFAILRVIDLIARTE